ncbi:MAG: hypothetical protein WCA37_16475 [Terracidiphilus sp.]
MKRAIWAFAAFIVFASTQVWAIKTITVGELEDLLSTMQQQKKTDEQIADALKQVQLSEELTVSTMNGLIQYVPGKLTTEQIYVLEARSANLAPPKQDIPSDPAPDANAQQAILTKAANYVAGVYNKLPDLTATKTTLRFQDNVEAVAPSSGVKGSVTDVTTGAGFSNPAYFVHYINSTETTVSSMHGAERLPGGKDNTPWGANRMIAVKEPDPSLGTVFQQAQAAGTLQWLRWELVNGKRVAVFSFSVSKKKSAHMAVNICCFPDVSQTGIARFYTATSGPMLGGGSSGGGGVAGNMQTNTDWHDYKSEVPYHGRIFIEPESGIVVRMITEPELKPAEVVHQADTRVDYGPVKVGQSTLIVPVKTVVNTVVVPNGDSQAGTYTTRCTLFTSEFKDYQLGAGK